jgi:hypothetical protein
MMGLRKDNFTDYFQSYYRELVAFFCGGLFGEENLKQNLI